LFLGISAFNIDTKPTPCVPSLRRFGQNPPVAPYPRDDTSAVQPIIPTWKREPFDDLEWVFDFKYDGFRGLCYLEQDRCRFISRNGKRLEPLRCAR
jgi:hypothetical protein